jgi:hypothetical protein
LEALIEILDAAAAVGASVFFRWVRRNIIHETDALSKFEDVMDFGLSSRALSRVWAHFGTCDIDAFAAPHNNVLPRFFARHETHMSEATDAFSVSWSQDRLFILPEFGRGAIDKVLDRIERDKASVVCVFPHWTNLRFWA